MGKSFDVVLVQFQGHRRPYAFKAPKYSDLNPGDTVIVDGLNGVETDAIVINHTNFNMDYDAEDYQFMLDAVGAREPLKKIKAKMSRKDFEYDDEEDNEDE